VNPKGYIEGRVWQDGKRRDVKRHRHVMEQHMGRLLEAHEDVHHKNEDKRDNRPENLEVMSHGAHSKLHNRSRKYPKGYKLDLSGEERRRRSERMRRMHAARRN
jgi:hypothetical protein